MPITEPTFATYDEIAADLAAHRPEGRDPDVAWVVVAAGETAAKNYAYRGVFHVFTNEGEGYGPVTLMVALGQPGKAEAHEYAVRQCDRLRSGLYTGWVVDTYADALATYEAAIKGETP